MDTFDFSKDVSDMEAGELRATLRDMVAKHNDQVGEAEDLEDERDEFKEQYEEASEDVEEATSYFAEKVAEAKDMDSEVLADRFSLDELRTEVEGLGDEDHESTFDEKPEKSDNLPGEDGSEFSEDARSFLEESRIIAPEQ